jgi:hypothetical protein
VANKGLGYLGKFEGALGSDAVTRMRATLYQDVPCVLPTRTSRSMCCTLSKPSLLIMNFRESVLISTSLTELPLIGLLRSSYPRS